MYFSVYIYIYIYIYIKVFNICIYIYTYIEYLWEFVLPTTCLPCCQVLSLSKPDCLGVDDDFFQMGGSSLLAGQLAGIIRKEFKVRLPCSGGQGAVLWHEIYSPDGKQHLLSFIFKLRCLHRLFRACACGTFGLGLICICLVI